MRGADDPFSHIDMGGMFTVLKVREPSETLAPASWYKHPKGTVSEEASLEQLRADGIAVP